MQNSIRHSFVRYLTADSNTPETHWNLFDSNIKDLRFRVPSSKTITVNSITASNLPMIAEQELGDPSLWWAILHFNGLLDPIDDISVGTTLRIPNRAQLLALLSSASASSQTSSSKIVVI